MAGENVLYLDRSGLESDIAMMTRGLEAFQEAVRTINQGVDAAPEHWRGATQTAYMDTYNDLRDVLTKQVPDSVQGMISYMQQFLNDMMSNDETGAARLR